MLIIRSHPALGRRRRVSTAARTRSIRRAAPARGRHEKASQELLLKRRARTIAVPTNDGEVRRWLRWLGGAVTLLGEKEMDRGDRLRAIMANLDALGHLDWLLKALEEEDEAAAAAARGVEEEEESAVYPCYREGWQGLARARVEIAKFSMARAASRIMRAK